MWGRRQQAVIVQPMPRSTARVKMTFILTGCVLAFVMWLHAWYVQNRARVLHTLLWYAPFAVFVLLLTAAVAVWLLVRSRRGAAEVAPVVEQPASQTLAQTVAGLLRRDGLLDVRVQHRDVTARTRAGERVVVRCAPLPSTRRVRPEDIDAFRQFAWAAMTDVAVYVTTAVGLLPEAADLAMQEPGVLTIARGELAEVVSGRPLIPVEYLDPEVDGADALATTIPLED